MQELLKKKAPQVQQQAPQGFEDVKIPDATELINRLSRGREPEELVEEVEVEVETIEDDKCVCW